MFRSLGELQSFATESLWFCNGYVGEFRSAGMGVNGNQIGVAEEPTDIDKARIIHIREEEILVSI